MAGGCDPVIYLAAVPLPRRRRIDYAHDSLDTYCARWSGQEYRYTRCGRKPDNHIPARIPARISDTPAFVAAGAAEGLLIGDKRTPQVINQFVSLSALVHLCIYSAKSLSSQQVETPAEPRLRLSYIALYPTLQAQRILHSPPQKIQHGRKKNHRTPGIHVRRPSSRSPIAERRRNVSDKRRRRGATPPQTHQGTGLCALSVSQDQMRSPTAVLELHQGIYRFRAWSLSCLCL